MKKRKPLEAKPYHRLSTWDVPLPEQVPLSIVIPTFRRHDLLMEAIDSALKAKGEDNRIEVLVVSNDPSDLMEEVLARYEDKPISFVVNEENLGMVGNQNQAICIARGEYVCLLHDDDLLLKSHCEKMMHAIAKWPDTDCFISKRHVLLPDNEWGHQKEAAQHKKALLSRLAFWKFLNPRKDRILTPEGIFKACRNPFHAPTAGTTFKRSSFVEFGGFFDEWKYSFDFVFFRYFSERYKVRLIPDVLGVYRMLESATNRPEVQEEFFEAFHSIVDAGHVNGKPLKDPDVYLAVFLSGLSNDCQKIVHDHYPALAQVSGVKIKWRKLCSWAYFFSSGVETEDYRSRDKILQRLAE